MHLKNATRARSRACVAALPGNDVPAVQLVCLLHLHTDRLVLNSAGEEVPGAAMLEASTGIRPLTKPSPDQAQLDGHIGGPNAECARTADTLAAHATMLYGVSNARCAARCLHPVLAVT